MVTARVPPGLSTRYSSSSAPDVVGDVLHHLAGDDAVERVVGVRQQRGVAADAVGQARRRGLAGLDHGPEQGPDLDQLGRGHVAGDDPGAAAEGLVGVAAVAAAEVEQQVAGAQAERS